MHNQENINISFLIPAKDASLFLETTLSSLFSFLESNFYKQYEIILILNGENQIELTKMMSIATNFQQKCPILKICFSHKKGKGAALKEGFLLSKGMNIFFTDADLPYDLIFFKEAYALLSHGHHFITGNRRSENSLFTLPVSVLPFAYSRHRIGLAFNRVVRTIFKIKSHDTQAGLKAFSRSLGEKVFSLDLCSGFLFDLEFFLVSMNNGYKHTELPIHLYLKTEKSTVRILKETIETGRWLIKIFIRNLKEYYHFNLDDVKFSEHYFITADDWGMSPSVNRGILKLAEKGIISRVSIMPDGQYANYYLDELKKINGIELGIHLNLTYDSYFSSPFDLLVNMINPFIKQKKELLITNEIKRQFGLIKNLNIDISYADGHHHCHVFPGVVDIFLEALKEYNIRESRLPYNWSFLFSSKIILLIFSLMAKRKFKSAGIIYRPFFYPDFSSIDSILTLKNKLKNKMGFEVITHPSDLADFALLSINDHYNHQRVREFDLLTALIPNEI